MTELPQNAAEALKLLVNAKFRPFDDMDWSAWAGCESAEPMVAEIGELTVILDGDYITFNQYGVDGDCEWASCKMSFEGLY